MNHNLQFIFKNGLRELENYQEINFLYKAF